MSGCNHAHENENIRSNGDNVCFWGDYVTNPEGIAEENDCIIFISNSGIMKYDKSRRKTDCLIKSENINSMRLYNNLIYFCENNDTIYKIDLNGEKQDKVLELSQVKQLLDEENISHFEIYEDYVYIKSSGTSLIRFSMTTHKAEGFAEDVSEYAFLNNLFFYTDHAEKTFSIFEIDLKTNENVLLLGDGISKQYISLEEYELYDNLASINGRLYYTTRAPAKIYRLEQDGNDTPIENFDDIKDAEYLTISTNNERLYYVLESGAGEGILYEYDTQTELKKEVARLEDINYVNGIKIIYGYVFYTSNSAQDLSYIRLS